MDSGIYLNAAGALAAEARMDVIANNIANVETPGFKRSFTLQSTRPPAAQDAVPPARPGRPDLDALGGGLFIQEVAFDVSPGGLRDTGAVLDMAIEGDGWFGVEHRGEVFYSRAGNFRRGADGTLTTADGGGLVLDEGGGVITLPATEEIEVASDGTISAAGEAFAKIGVFGSLDASLFEPQGGTLFRYKGEGALPPTEQFIVHQGMLEQSTTDPVREMVKMIQTFRAYETNQRMIALQDQSLGRAVNDVGRLA